MTVKRVAAGSSIFKLNEELRAELDGHDLIGVGADGEGTDSYPSVE